MWFAVERDRPSDQIRIATEAVPPETLADDRNAVSGGGVLGRRQHAPDDRRESHRAEHRRRGDRRVEPIWAIAAGEVHGRGAINAEVLEDLILIAPVLKIRPRHRHVAAIGGPFGQRENSIDVGIRQRPQHHTVENAEDRRRRADAERERQQHDRGKAGIARERAQRVANVVGNGLQHRAASGAWVGRIERGRDFDAGQLPRQPYELRVRFTFGVGRRHATLAQLAVSILKVLRQLFDDVRAARGRETQARQTAIDDAPEIRHSRHRRCD